MFTILWFVVAVLVVLWLLSLTAFHLGTLLWLFLVAAIVVAIVNLFTRGTSGSSL